MVVLGDGVPLLILAVLGDGLRLLLLLPVRWWGARAARRGRSIPPMLSFRWLPLAIGVRR
jgi:hypothetical protein